MRKVSKKTWKSDTHQILHKIWAKHDFSCFRKKNSKKVTFFHFSKLKIDVWLKMPVLSRKWLKKYFLIFKSLSDAFPLQIRKTSKNTWKCTKFGQNTTFHVSEKKLEKSNFFSFFETQNRCLTKNVSFVKKMRKKYSLIF